MAESIASKHILMTAIRDEDITLSTMMKFIRMIGKSEPKRAIFLVDMADGMGALEEKIESAVTAEEIDRIPVLEAQIYGITVIVHAAVQEWLESDRQGSSE